MLNMPFCQFLGFFKMNADTLTHLHAGEEKTYGFLAFLL